MNIARAGGRLLSMANLATSGREVANLTELGTSSLLVGLVIAAILLSCFDSSDQRVLLRRNGA